MVITNQMTNVEYDAITYGNKIFSNVVSEQVTFQQSHDVVKLYCSNVTVAVCVKPIEGLQCVFVVIILNKKNQQHTTHAATEHLPENISRK